jgi:NTP pyrophosphatase (non-canonical NTP hydrolase)
MVSIYAERAHEFIEKSEEVTGHRGRTFWMLKLAEENGEAVQAYNRFAGWSRKVGPIEHVAKELGDVLYCCFILAEKLGIDLDESAAANFDDVMTRGFKE